MKDYIAEAENRRKRAELAEHEANLRERAVIAAERQAAALERIAASLEKIEEPIANNMGDMEAHIYQLTLAIEKIAGSKGIVGIRNVDAV